MVLCCPVNCITANWAAVPNPVVLEPALFLPLLLVVELPVQLTSLRLHLATSSLVQETVLWDLGVLVALVLTPVPAHLSLG